MPSRCTEDRAGRELLRGHWQDAHAERPGQAVDQLLLDHRQLTVGLDFELADVAGPLDPSKGFGQITRLGSVRHKHMAAIGAEDRAFRIVECLEHLKDHRG